MVTGAIDGEARGIARNMLFGEPIDPLSILESIDAAAASGAIGTVLKPGLSRAWSNVRGQAEKGELLSGPNI